MMMQPKEIAQVLVEKAFQQLIGKKLHLNLMGIRFQHNAEGVCAQTLHIGHYSEEGPTIARLHAFIQENGYEPRGKHHEIYLSDPRKTKPEKLRTILRQPIVRSS
jgi:hypothetical protein